MLKNNLKKVFYFVVFVCVLNICHTHTALGYSADIHCQAKSFWDFFDQFSESVEMQKACTHFPLDKTELITEENDLSPKIIQLTREQVHFPLILNKDNRLKKQIHLKIESKNNKKAIVVLYKPDTGYQIVYLFKKKKKWQLVKIADWSV